jgi:leader peptidase (prepilin peptidase)/N-methyltransferase
LGNIYNFSSLNSFNSFTNIDLFLYSLFLLSIGSFVSAVIFRTSSNLQNNTKALNILYPRSFCPKCNHQIKILYLLPLVGFFLQWGKCKICKNKISFFYPITEISFLLIGLLLAFVYGFGIFCFFLLLLFSIFYVLFYLDLKYYYLPYSINILLVPCGFVGNTFFNIFVADNSLIFNLSPLQFSLYGLLAGYISLWSVNFIFKLISKRDGIGGGDFILFGGIGSLLGPFSLGLILFMASLFGCLMFLIDRKKNKERIPLGSCLILGSICYFLIKNFELLDNFLVI